VNNLQLAEDLCASSTSLHEARRRHVKHHGALLPHVFMGEVLAYVGAGVGGPAATMGEVPSAEISEILCTLERGMASGDRETRNVIAMSFVWDAELEPYFGRLRPLLGPKVRAQLQRR
jgi:hypothetical protein